MIGEEVGWVPQRSGDGTFAKGVSGNPRGRPPGSRSKLADAYLGDMLAVWEEKGRQAILDFLDKDPGAFVRAVATLLPKHFNIKVNELDDLTDEQLDQRIATLARAIEAAEAAAGRCADQQGQAQAAQPPLLLPSLSEAG